MYVSRVLTQNLTQWTVLSGTAGRGSCQAIHQIIGFLVKVGTFLFLARSHKCCCLPLNKQAMDDRQPSFVAPLGLTLGILPQLWTISRLLTLLSFDNSQLFRCTIHSLSSACDVVVYPGAGRKRTDRMFSGQWNKTWTADDERAYRALWFFPTYCRAIGSLWLAAAALIYDGFRYMHRYQ